MKVQNYQDHSNISTIIDQRLGNRFTAEGMEEFIQLIIRCVDTSSERRPSMSYVLMELDRILEKETTLTTLVGEGIPNVILGSQLFKASKWKEWGFGLFASNCWVWSLWNTFYFLIFSLFKKRKKEKKRGTIFELVKENIIVLLFKRRFNKIQLATLFLLFIYLFFASNIIFFFGTCLASFSVLLFLSFRSKNEVFNDILFFPFEMGVMMDLQN